MSRPLDPDMTTALTASAVRPFFLADFTFDTETLRLWSGYGNLTAPTGNTLISNGDFSNGLTDWTAFTLGVGTVTHVNNAVELYSTGFQNRAGIRQTFTTVANKTYRVNFTTTASTRVVIRDQNANANIFVDSVGAGTAQIDFTAPSTSTRLDIRNQLNQTITVDNISIYETEDYVGAGDLLTLSGFEETSDLSAQGVTATLSGMNSDIVQKARDDNYQGNPVRIRLGTLNSSGDVINTPVSVFNGFMDVMSIQDEGSSCTVTLAVENKLIRLERSNVRRYTSEDQKVEHPTDKGFEFVTKIQEVEVNWGKGTVSSLGGRGNKVRNGRETEH